MGDGQSRRKNINNFHKSGKGKGGEGGKHWTNSGGPAKIKECMELAFNSPNIFRKKTIMYVKLAGFLANGDSSRLKMKKKIKLFQKHIFFL